MKAVLLILIVACAAGDAFGQAHVRGRLKTRDSIEFSIVHVLPDSFPAVSIILKAHKANGDPLWNLKKEDFQVMENGEEATVKFLTPISRDKPINVGIVFDHSGSMQYDTTLLYDKNGRELFHVKFNGATNTIELVYPKGYIAPIDNGKTTTMEFAKSFNFKKDFISVVGFSSSVDRVLPLTNNKEKIDSVISSMKADSLTALYDGMLAGLNQLTARTGVNVLVTLTDGMNNKSKSTWNDVVEKAVSLDVPIFIIGLGSVNKDTLQMIADNTNGQFIYTETSKSFSEIYTRLSKEIQSFYDLRYESMNLSSMESKRKLTISFVTGNPSDTLSYDYQLPNEVTVYLETRARQERTYIIGTSVVTAIVLTMGTVVYRRKRRRRAN